MSDLQPNHSKNFKNENENEFSTEDRVKHKAEKKSGRELERKHALVHIKKNLQQLYQPSCKSTEYLMRNIDGVRKIQGTDALINRGERQIVKVKACYFASLLAILYANLKAPENWKSENIDRVIAQARIFNKRQTNSNVSYERVFKSLQIEDYEFEARVRNCQQLGLFGSNATTKIATALRQKRTILLQTANTTYAIYGAAQLHLFDPYPSMELLQDQALQKMKEIQLSSLQLLYTSKNGGMLCTDEQNTASWVLFEQIPELVAYVSARTSNEHWQENANYELYLIEVLSQRKPSLRPVIAQLMCDIYTEEDKRNICHQPESIGWLERESSVPIWSRFNTHNMHGLKRHEPHTLWDAWHIEVNNQLWSLWGNLHPHSQQFNVHTRGKQYLACNVMACCAAHLYILDNWNALTLDSIVSWGNHYYQSNLHSKLRLSATKLTLMDLDNRCRFKGIDLRVDFELILLGKLYCLSHLALPNLATGLTLFFRDHEFGILQCHDQSLAIGRDTSDEVVYFMFDCQSWNHPLFPQGQEVAYALRTRSLQALLYCITVTLNVTRFNVEYSLYKVDVLELPTQIF